MIINSLHGGRTKSEDSATKSRVAACALPLPSFGISPESAALLEGIDEVGEVGNEPVGTGVHLLAHGNAAEADFPWDSDGYKAPTPAADVIDGIPFDGKAPNAYIDSLPIGLKSGEVAGG